MLGAVMRGVGRLSRTVVRPVMLALACVLTPVTVLAQPVQSADWQWASPGGVGVALAGTSTGDYLAVGIESRSTIDPAYGAIMTVRRNTRDGHEDWSVRVPTAVAGLRPSKVFVDGSDNIIVLANEADYNYTVCSLADPNCTAGQVTLFSAWWIVQKYSPDGALIWQRRELKARLVPVDGVADAVGDLYVAFDPDSSAQTATVQRLDGATGGTLWSAATPDGAKPGAVALSSTGSVLLAAAGTSFGLSINEFAADLGTRLTRSVYPAAAGHYAPAMAVGPRGEIAFTGRSANGLFLGLETPARQTNFALSTTTPGAQGRRVAIDSQGHVVVAGTTPDMIGTNWLLLRYDAAGAPRHAPVVINRHASAAEEPSALVLADSRGAYVTGAAGPGTSADPGSMQAVTVRLASDGGIDWIASAASGRRGVGATLAWDGAVGVLTAGDMTLLHYPASAPVVPTAVALTPTSVRGGKGATASVTVSASTGAVLQLSSSNPTVAPVPASLTVPAGASSASFAIKTTKVKVNTSVTITATVNGMSKAATLIVLK